MIFDELQQLLTNDIIADINNSFLNVFVFCSSEAAPDIYND